MLFQIIPLLKQYNRVDTLKLQRFLLVFIIIVRQKPDELGNGSNSFSCVIADRFSLQSKKHHSIECLEASLDFSHLMVPGLSA